MIRLPPRRLKPRRHDPNRSPAHLRFVRSHRCCVIGCVQEPIEAAHVRTAANSGTGIKPPDSETVSLCQFHHAESHQIGTKSFERKHGLDLASLAAEFWRTSPARKRLEAA